MIKKWEGEWLADEECNSLTNNPYGICDACRPSDYEERWACDGCYCL